MSNLDPARVDRALRLLISDIDYDTHKSLENDEETGEDSYPELVQDFIISYEKSN
ncbi:hypothetical protein [Paenarthrobacter sp. CAP02]|uniref:hypothetical protein n=1 Tax=Paenarthrobacter sp. CAP02 TaxID=3158144 RepID=UPI0032DB1B7B